MIDLGVIAERLRQARNNSNLTLDEVADKSGFSARTIRRYEHEGLQDLIKLDKLCSIYNTAITDIIAGENDMQYLATTIKRLGPDACRVLVNLCESMGFCQL